MKRLAIITTHPIQYNAPFFKLLSERNNIVVKVFYTWEQSDNLIYDPDFKIERKWDINLLEGYQYQFVKNVSKNPGSHSFFGIKNPTLISEIKKWNPDCLLIYGWAFWSHLHLMYKFKNKIPVFFRGDSTLLDRNTGNFLKNIFRSLILNFVYKNIDVAFYTGIENKKYFLKYGLKDRQLVFAPHAIENERFSFSEKLTEEAFKLRESYKVEDAELILLFVGKFQKKKDPKLLIDAFNGIGRKNCSLFLIGNGELETELKLLANNNKKIHFIPFQNQSMMPVWYHFADIFILPSCGPGESWGLAVNEAMAAGKAIITSNKVGCYSDLVKVNENGYVFDAGNLAQLEKAIQNFLCDKSLVTSFGLKSKEYIKNWTFEKFAIVIENKMIFEKN